MKSSGKSEDARGEKEHERGTWRSESRTSKAYLLRGKGRLPRFASDHREGGVIRQESVYDEKEPTRLVISL